MNKRKNHVLIRTLNKRTQVVRNFCGAYDMSDGFIEVGCDEDHIATILWHEYIHKFLFESFNLEAGVMWDNIANELQEYLFEIGIQDEPHIFSMPPAKAKPEDDGWYVGRKQREKSERVGFKPDPKIKCRIPIRVHRTIITEVYYHY